jgi:hypothetical protein
LTLLYSASCAPTPKSATQRRIAYEGLTYAPSIIAAVLTPLRLSSPAIARPSIAAHPRAPRLRGARHRARRRRRACRPLIVALLFGGRYAPAVQPLQILAAGSVFVFATWILHAAAISTNLDRRLLLTTAIGLAANVALNIVLIPRYGISGAAWATVVAEGLTVFLLLVQLQRRLRRP